MTSASQHTRLTTAQDSASRLRFTIFKTNGSRLSKQYRLESDGSVDTELGTQFAQGSYRVEEFDARNPAGALAEISRVLDALSSSEAIGLGVPLDGSVAGQIVTRLATSMAAQTRSRARWNISAGPTVPACCCSTATTSTGCRRY